MKEKLTLGDLAPYLPYNIEFMKPFTRISNGRLPEIEEEDEYPEILTLKDLELVIKYQFKIVLRPISDLAKEIKVNGERFLPIDKYYDIFGINDDYLIEVMNEDEGIYIQDIKNLPYYVVNWLISLHFDVFGLIPQGLAININTLK